MNSSCSLSYHRFKVYMHAPTRGGGLGGGGKRGGMRRKRHQASSKIVLKVDSENQLKADHVQSGVFHP